MVRSGSSSGIEKKYHELNADAEVPVAAFIERYQNAERLLRSFGLEPYVNDYEPWLEDEETLNLISRYKGWLEPKEKRFAVLQHDIVLWRVLREIRHRGNSALAVGAFFVTCDYTLWQFDQKRLRKKGETASSILPNVLLQLLRPFVPRTPDFDAGLAETLALPQFRSAQSADAQAVSRVATTLSLYGDLPEDVAAGMLSDQVLLDRVRGVEEGREREVEALVEEALAAELARLNGELARMGEQVEAEKLERLDLHLEIAALKAAREQDERLKAEAAEGLLTETARAEKASIVAERAAALAARSQAERDDLSKSKRELEDRLRVAEDEGKATKARLFALGQLLLGFCLAFAAREGLNAGSLSSRQGWFIGAGGGVYGVALALLEQLKWFRRRNMHHGQFRLSAVGLLAAWAGLFTIGHGSETWTGIFGAAVLALLADVVRRLTVAGA